VKDPLNVFATFLNNRVVSKKVLAPEFVCTDARVISPPPVGVAKVPSPLRNVVVLFGGVGTAPPTVALITGRSAPVAIDGTPVPVVFFNIPVLSPDSNVPLIPTTVNPADPVASPVCVAFVTREEYKVLTALSPVFVPLDVPENVPDCVARVPNTVVSSANVPAAVIFTKDADAYVNPARELKLVLDAW